MTPMLEHTRDLHDWLARRLSELSNRAASLVEEARDCIGDELGWLSADIAALHPVIEELQDRERFNGNPSNRNQ